MGMVRSIRRASSRAGLRDPLHRGLALVAPCASCAWRSAPATRAPRAAIPMRNSTTSNGATSAPIPSARHGTSVGHGTCSAPDSSARRRELTAARDRDELRALRECAARVISNVSSVSPEYDIANTSVLGADERGRAVLLEHDERHRQRRGGQRLHHVAGDARAAHAEHDDVLDVGRARQLRRRRSCAAASCAAASCSGSRAERPPNARVSTATSVPRVEGGLHAVGRRPWPSRRSSSASSTVSGVVDQHDRDVVVDRVAALEARVVERLPRRRSRAAGPCPPGRPGSRAAAGRGAMLHS